MEKENFIKLFEKSFRDYFNCPALSEYGTEIKFTYGEIAKEIEKLHILFEESGIKVGNKITLVGKNTARWCIAYLATVTYGAVIVPVLQDFNSADITHIINHSESSLIFSSDSIWETLDKNKIPEVKGVFSLTDFRMLYQRNGEPFNSLIPRIEELFDKKFPEGFGAENIQYIDYPNSEVLVLNYTSGTTGFSKGVIITGSNLTGNLYFAWRTFNLSPTDKMLSFLPLAHTYGCAFEFLYALSVGCDVTLLGKIPSPQILLKAFNEVKPVLIIGVPLIMEKIYRKTIMPAISKNPVKLFLRLPLLKLLIHRKIKNTLVKAFGENFNQVIVGGAPLNAEVEDFLLKIKFPISVGYGMTECAPLISFSLYPQYVPHSCGKVLDIMSVRIDSSDPYSVAGEIQVKGQNVMSGYYKNEEATRNAFTDDGWLKTGDLGTIDKDNNIFIRGRSKNMILSANGQNIYPEEIEAKLDNLPYVMESLVVERKKRLVALVYPDYDALEANGIKNDELAAIMNNNKEILNKMVASYEKIAEIQIAASEFEKTPKKSIKRFLYSN
jgi:long-chain acyl-CoA synthetase